MKVLLNKVRSGETKKTYPTKAPHVKETACHGRNSRKSLSLKNSKGYPLFPLLPGSSPSRIQGYRQDDGIGERIAKQREQRLDLPWLTQKANNAPVFQGVILKEEQSPN